MTDRRIRSEESARDRAERVARETHQGITMPEHFLSSPRKVLLWRALVAGERFNKHSAAARFGWHLSGAAQVIKELHQAGKVHIVGWTRNGDRGPKTEVIAFGPGEDAPRPEALDNAFLCKRWRARNHAQAIAIDRRTKLRRAIREGCLPRGNDPLLAAIMGGRI